MNTDLSGKQGNFERCSQLNCYVIDNLYMMASSIILNGISERESWNERQLGLEDGLMPIVIIQKGEGAKKIGGTTLKGQKYCKVILTM